MQGNGQGVSSKLFHLDPPAVGKHHLDAATDVGCQFGPARFVTLDNFNPLARRKLAGFFHQKMVFR